MRLWPQSYVLRFHLPHHFLSGEQMREHVALNRSEGSPSDKWETPRRIRTGAQIL